MDFSLVQPQRVLKLVWYEVHTQYHVGPKYYGKTCIAIAIGGICHKTTIFVVHTLRLTVYFVKKWKRHHLLGTKPSGMAEG